MRRNRWTMTLPLLPLIAALAVIAGAPSGSLITEQAQGADQQASQIEAGEVKTLTGRIVSAHEFLTVEEDAEELAATDRNPSGTLASDMPIVLIPEEQPLHERLLPGRNVFLIIFDPEDDEAASAYSAAREQVGERVQLVGAVHNRNGLWAISVLEEPVEAIEAPEDMED